MNNKEESQRIFENIREEINGCIDVDDQIEILDKLISTLIEYKNSKR